MPQLVFHGKKTVPAGIRHDVWRPYFSIRFPDNDGGKQAGLKAYQRLREFSLRRQLDPPQDELMATQADIDKFVKTQGNPYKLRSRYLSRDGPRKRSFQFPILGKKLPLKYRAQKLMDQKASSVADASFVLGLALEQLKPLYQKRYNSEAALLHATEAKVQGLGRRARRTLGIKRSHEQEKAEEIAQRQELASKVDMSKGMLPLTKDVAEDLSIQFGGGIQGESNRVLNMQPARNDYDDECEIQVAWADIRDGTYAESWPDGVFHGELQPHALTKRASIRVIQEEYTAEDGVMVSKQSRTTQVVAGSSVHVHGDAKPPGFRTFQDELAVRHRAQREARREAMQAREFVQERQPLIEFYQKHSDTQDLAFRAEELRNMLQQGEHLSDADKALASKKDSVDKTLKQLDSERRDQEAAHPEEAREARELFELRKVIKALRSPQTEAIEAELRYYETTDEARYAAASKLVDENPEPHAFPDHHIIAEVQAVADLVAGRSRVVLPDENFSIWSRMKTIFRRI